MGDRTAGALVLAFLLAGVGCAVVGLVQWERYEAWLIAHQDKQLQWAAEDYAALLPRCAIDSAFNAARREVYRRRWEESEP